MTAVRPLSDRSSTATAASPLAACVHCGFCLPACPTYLATGDEADSPRGRIVLMRALERGEIPATDPALNEHLDACLGCRGCEPVCPSGVAYGRGLGEARVRLVEARGLSPLARLVLAVFRRRWLWRPTFAAARWFRDLGMARALAGRGRFGFAMGMLGLSLRSQATGSEARGTASLRGDSVRPTVALFRGCVMDTLFSHVHDATIRTLTVNGYEVIELPGQRCCGALHEHAGDIEPARELALANVRAFAALAKGADYIVVNSAGCGALLEDYAHLLGTDEARIFASRVRDVTELLAEAGPVAGGALPLDVAYDAPCHLQHAQGVQAAPLRVLAAIPGLRLRLLPGSDKCCGSAGIYSLLRPDMARSVLDLKIDEFARAEPTPGVIATGNPGCIMQITAGLSAAGLDIRVAHPIELLDASYSAAGLY